MRYRSATVAGFHGLSRCPERMAKNGDTEAGCIGPGKPVRCAKLGKISVNLTTLPLAALSQIDASTYTQEKICSLAKEARHPTFNRMAHSQSSDVGSAPAASNAAASDALRALFDSRIVVLDGAMGSMIQTYKLGEADFRGQRLTSHPHDLKGNNDLLCLTKPEVIEEIHTQYFEAGADMVETNTFNSTSISQSDYKLESLVREINLAAAAIARRAAKKTEAKTPGRRCFVAGAVGPLNRTLSLSPDVNRPDFRAVVWDEVVAAYTEQVQALLDGGVDALLVETIFDTLNAKAALFAIENVFETRGQRVPVMISVTITDASGRTLSGQTVNAFYNSVRHAKPFSVGINCALGGRAMRPYIEELSSIAECYVTCYPNAGLPNAFGGYDETPEQMAEVLGEFAANGFVNMVGGCCGSTPAHIAAIAAVVKSKAPRVPVLSSSKLQLSGLEALTV
jgi:5-methyltetrahydrofolate--homocysteine methyltransferase